MQFVQVLLSGRLQLDYRKGKNYLDNGTEIQQLRSYYQDIPGPGSSKKRHIKLYISKLKFNTAGNCGVELTNQIERSRLNEQVYGVVNEIKDSDYLATRLMLFDRSQEDWVELSKYPYLGYTNGNVAMPIGDAVYVILGSTLRKIICPTIVNLLSAEYISTIESILATFSIPF